MLDAIVLSRYGLFASVSTILKTNMGKYLKDIVKYMIESLQSTEGIVVSKKSVACCLQFLFNH